MLGFIGAFGVVFLLLGLALRWLGRLNGSRMQRRGGVRMEVVQRLSLGPKQGIAVVRIGERVLAVSMGDGGVRQVAELSEADVAPVPGGEAETAAERLLPVPASFRAVLAAATEHPRTQRLKAIAQEYRAKGLAAGREHGSPKNLAAAIREHPAAKQFKAALRTAVRSAALLLAIAALAGLLDGSAVVAAAQTSPEAIGQLDQTITELAPQIDVRVGQGGEGLRLSGTVGVVVMMGLLTLLPTLLLMMTSFTRIFVVLHFLRQALGTQSAPPAHLMAGLALLLTGFVMAPTLGEVNRTALEPWMNGQMEQGQMLATAAVPFREFMLGETRESDIVSFLDMSNSPPIDTADQIPLVVLMSAFVTSELRTAFQIGFAVFLPFIVIDVVVASVLMSMGMFMLPPPMIALPFKILLFVLVDGWTLVVQGLVSSFS